MKLIHPRYVQRESIPEAPPWIERILAAYNATFRRFTEVVDGNISAKDNLNAETVTLEIEHDTQFEFRLRTLRGRARDAWVSRVVEPEGIYSPRLAWRESASDSDKLVCKCHFTEGAGTYTVRIRVEGD